MRRIASLLAGLLCAACAGGELKPPDLTTVAALPKLSVAPNDLSRIEASPTQAYERIARGALSCWFGPTGALKGSHLFYADAEPATETRAGAAEIAIHERDLTQPKPWGRKVMRIVLTPADAKTALAIENLKLPDPLFQQMKTDVYAWSMETPSCTAGEGGTGFYKPPVAPPAPPKKSRRKRG